MMTIHIGRWRRGTASAWLVLGSFWLGFVVPARLSAGEPQHLKGQVPAAVAHVQSIGRLPGGSNLCLAIGLPLRNQTELTSLLSQLYDPASPNYHRFLTPAQFAARFGPDPQDYETLGRFARTNGLTITRTHPNRLVLDVAGPASQMERVFHVALRLYTHPVEARSFFAPDTEPTLALAVPVASVSGLNNYRLPHPMSLKPGTPGNSSGARPQGGSGWGGTFRGYDFRQAYVPGTALTGAGQTLGLVEFSCGFYQSDVDEYVNVARLPEVPVTPVLVDNYDGGPGTNCAECSLDIELAIAMAPGLTQVLVYEGVQADDILNQMATDNLAKQLSASWGYDTDATTEAIFQQFAAQGQSFFNASGDEDAAVDGAPSPCDDPYITIVGGTTLTTADDHSWASETVWNDGQGYPHGSGGGISTNYSIPIWQQGVDMSQNQGSTTMRNYPDVAMVADDVYVIYDNQNIAGANGTSCAAPLWAAFTALINEQGAMNGETSVGFLNPAIYALGQGGNFSGMFHDVVMGNNIWDDSSDRFFAVPGYDLCTGWGSPMGQSLIDALVGPVVPAPPTITSQPQNQTDVIGTTVTLTVGAAGAVPLSYQWSFNGSNLAGATNAWLTLSAVQFDQAGEYSVLVTNALGSVISSNAELTVQSCDPDPLGLVSWWPGDGTAQDVMGLNNGVLEGGVGFTNGEVGQAFWFADPTADVRIPASGSLDVGTGAGFTVEAWINCATGTQLNPIFEWNPGDGVTQEGVHFYVWSDGSLYGNVVDAGGKVTDDAFYSDPDLILPNVFYHVALTYDQASGVEAMYLNGLLVADEILGPITPQTSYDLYLGRRPPTAGATYEFSGALDAPAVYNRALSPAELRAIFQAGVNGKCGPFNAPVVLLSPASQTAAVGRDVVFSVAALGAPPLTYQWWFNGTPIFAAATNATLTLTNLEFSAAGNYSVTVSNLYGSAASSNAGLLVVAQPPAISTQPDNQTVEVGGTVSFTVSASGSLPQSFQWSFAGAALAGATNATLTLLDVQPDQAGDYRVVVTNALGSAASSNAVLLVEFCDPDPAGLVSWWPGAGNALDYMGTNNGVLEGGVGFTNGEVGRAFWFNNASADVRIPASASLNVGTRGGFTVEAWVKCATVTQLNPIFEWNQGDAVTNEGAHLYVYSNGALYGNVVGTNGAVVKNVFYSSAGLVASNVFYHVALTYDQVAGMEFLYLNGVLVARKSIGSITPQTSFDLYLGRRPPTQGETYSFAGTIDEPSLYDRALSAAELLAIYQAGSGGKCLPAVVPTIHFTWAPLPALRFVNVPFTATIQAQNATNGPATNFVGTVALTATPGVALTPSVSGAFRQGTWTGMLTVGQPVSNLVLQASDGLGDTGLANAINIVNPPGLSSVCSGGNLLLLWPSALPGFVMETAPALNATNWVPVSTPPTQIGGQFLESLPLAATNAFFRLRYVAP